MKARLLVIDVETYRTRNEVVAARIEQEAIEKEPANNTKRELKEVWNTEIARAMRAREAVAKTACDPLLAEPICVCWMTESGEPCGVVINDAQDLLNARDELEALAGPETIWIGHNIAGFDLGVLFNAWTRNQIQPPEHFPMWHGRYWSGRVFDTMLRTPNRNGLGLISLDDACAAYGIEVVETDWDGAPMDGSRVGEAFEAGLRDIIFEYCKGDVATEMSLYLVLTGGDRWGTYDRYSSLAVEVAEIEESELSPTQKALSIYSLLDRAGLIPRMARAA